MPETDFGTWLLVSRQRGHARGCGGSSRASHVPSDVAAGERTDAPVSPDPVTTGTRGGLRGIGRGRHISSLALYSNAIAYDLTSENTFPMLQNPPVDALDPHPDLQNPAIDPAPSNDPQNSICPIDSNTIALPLKQQNSSSHDWRPRLHNLLIQKNLFYSLVRFPDHLFSTCLLYHHPSLSPSVLPM